MKKAFLLLLLAFTQAVSAGSVSPPSPIIFGGGTVGKSLSATGGSGQYVSIDASGNLGVSTPSGGSGIPNGRYHGYYPLSALNYWSNGTTGSTYGNFTVNGTIPSPTTLYPTVGFTSVGLAASSLPGIAFTAPTTGTVFIEFDIVQVASGSTTAINYQLFETTTSTIVGTAAGDANGYLFYATQSVNGFFDVTASTSYNIIVQSTLSAGTNNIGSTIPTAAANAPELTIRMWYIH